MTHDRIDGAPYRNAISSSNNTRVTDPVDQKIDDFGAPTRNKEGIFFEKRKGIKERGRRRRKKGIHDSSATT
jgi:hypothetical protein